jgi:hypothetical protein
VSYTLYVPINREVMMADVHAFANVELPSGGDAHAALFMAAWENDYSQCLIYELALSIIGRSMLKEAGTLGTVIAARCEFENSAFGVDIRFANEQQAMLFKLAHGQSNSVS